MKITIPRPTEIDVDAIRCVLAVRYDEDDMPRNYPHRAGDTWDVTIDIDTGQIRDWPEGVPTRDLHMKVVDEGSYYLLSGKEVIAVLENDYVPDCIPEEYGDYVTFQIDEAGKITNWGATEKDIVSCFFPHQDV